MRKTYTRRNRKKLPRAVADLMQSAGQHKASYREFAAHIELFDRLRKAKANPWSVIIFKEPLDDSHWRSKKHWKMEKVQIWSEMEEVIYREFDRELNEKMAKYLETHKDPNDVYLKKLVKQYEPRALEIIKRRKRKIDMDKLWKRRTRTDRDRIYEMPWPFSHWDDRSPVQQYYVVPELAYFNTGGSGNSGHREVHSIHALGFAQYDEHRSIPTHVLVYDKHNELKLLQSLDRFCVAAPIQVGHNYDIRYDEVKRLLKNVCKAEKEYTRHFTPDVKVVMEVP